ncbi:MAG: M48 family metalloprotease [Xanthomonadales bacterium]|nr:M48 family metalloprotease [Xanthomonadales bacterium]
MTFWFTGLVLLGLSGQAAALMSEEAEIKLGKELHPRILAEVGPYPDPELQEYINRIGQELAAISDRPDLEYHFTVLDDDLVNAFALPGGYIYITRGMLAHLNSEAELAAVLGHEIGHVTARHSVKRDSQQKLLGALAAITSIAAKSTLAGEATNMVGQVMVTGYGRDQELEADELGAKFMAKAGYETNAVTATVALLKQREQFERERARAEDREPRIPHGSYRTHPDNDKRFREAVKAAQAYTPDLAKLRPDNSAKFLNMIDGIAFGPKRTPGTLRSNYFYNAKYGIKMKFPENWRVEGSASRLQAISDNNDAALEVSVVVPGRTMTAADVLMKKFAQNKLKDGKDITIAGMRAHIATVDRYSGGPYGARPARMAAILDNRVRRAYVFAGTGKRDLSRIAADGDFIGAIFSFGRMTAADRTLAEAPRLKIIQAEPDTTYEILARTSAVPTYAEQNIRLLNGVYPTGQPRPGDLIKTVD